MTERVRVEQSPGQPPRAVKAARPSERARLEHERSALDAARHPGVVTVVGWEDLEGGGAEMATGFVGSRSLASSVRLAPEQVAVIGAALARTLADLHALDITHGAVERSHVLLDQGGLPVLCGFARASVHGTGPPDNDSAAPSDDVDALGSLLTELLSAETESDPIPERRWSLGRANRRSTWLRRLLLSLADQASYPDAHRRPSAAALARSLNDAVPAGAPNCGAGTVRTNSAVHSSPGPVPAAERSPAASDKASPGRWLPVTAVAGLLLLGGGALTWLQPGSGAEPDVNEALVDAAESPAIQSRETVRHATSTAPSTGQEPEPSETSPTVLSAGRRFAVGEPGDVALVGDWNCDGSETAALVRPSTGEVFVFDGWAHDAQTSVTATTVIERASFAAARPDESGCDLLVVSTQEGDEHEIELADGRDG